MTTMSVTDAQARGLSALIREAETGQDVLLERRNQTVAAVVSIERLNEVRRQAEDLRDLTLVVLRCLTYDGTTVAWADVKASLGITADDFAEGARLYALDE